MNVPSISVTVTPAASGGGAPAGAKSSPEFLQVLQNHSVSREQSSQNSGAIAEDKSNPAQEAPVSTPASAPAKPLPPVKSKAASKEAESLPSDSSGGQQGSQENGNCAITLDAGLVVALPPPAAPAPQDSAAATPGTLPAARSQEATGAEQVPLLPNSSRDVTAWRTAGASASKNRSEAAETGRKAPSVSLPAVEGVASSPKRWAADIPPAAAPASAASSASAASPVTTNPQDKQSGDVTVADDNARGLAKVVQAVEQLTAQAKKEGDTTPLQTPPQVAVSALPELPREQKLPPEDDSKGKISTPQQTAEVSEAGSGDAPQMGISVPAAEKIAESKPAARKQGAAPAQDRANSALRDAREGADKKDVAGAEPQGRTSPPAAADALPQSKPEPTAATPVSGESVGIVPLANTPAQSPAQPVLEHAVHGRPAPASPVAGEELPKLGDARLAQQAGSAEMRVAFETEKLGAVELRARVSGDQVGAAIVVERHDAHAILAAELPGLRQSLEERQLRVEQMTLQQGAVGGGQGQGSSYAQPHGGGQGSARAAAAAWRQAAMAPSAREWPVENGKVFDSRGRLSVRA